VRKCLGVLVAAATLCAMSWGQAPPSAPTQAPPSAPVPAPAPTEPVPSAPTSQESSSAPAIRASGPKYPRIEWFGGYTYGKTGFFNAGHWAGLNGWDASFTLNATHWLGLLVDGGQYFGTTKIPTNSPAPFQSCLPFCPTTSPLFNANTREYNILFGAQFAYRKHEMWTPFGELMYGHQGVRGKAVGEDNFTDIEISSGRALVAGGGVDRRVNDRFALRFKAEYFQTATDFQRLGKKKQDNLRLSVGIVIRSVHKKKRRLEDETQPEP
jgi:hypothetical protein